MKKKNDKKTKKILMKKFIWENLLKHLFSMEILLNLKQIDANGF